MNDRHSILIVEDDVEIAEFLETGLTAEGFRISVVFNAEDLVERVARDQPALVILDRMLPDTDGADVCRRLRIAGHDTMVLLLTAKDSMNDKIDGLRAGADDYLTKPFGFGELLARLEALLRRRGQVKPRSELSVADLRLDLSLKTAYRAGQALGLTATEFSLLQFLVENAGSVMSRAQILQAVWGYEFDPNTNIVEVYINYLRKKVDYDQSVKLIRNVRGFGYVCMAPE